ncbi:MAG: hypothetical protein SFW36_20925, partial [Leptolyngbyaceae cyanobacterium bins.59]|nr:hypothetical protein [Leptolyngbyaceae cyanobacterium bins.59]
MVDPDQILNRLKGLLESQFKQLLLWLKVDESFLPSSETDRVTRSIALIRLLTQDEQGLQRLQTYLDRVHPTQPIAVPTCPYQGLSAFQEEHAAVFFGRETLTQNLMQCIKTGSFVAVVGASGSGKSSLVFAGLIPQLRTEGNWLIESLRPINRPFDGLASAFVHQLEPDLDKVDRIAKVTTLANTIQQYGVATVVSEILKDQPGQSLLLVVDQFEELFTLCSIEDRDRFIEVLLTGIKDSPGLKIILTLRADFCGQAYAVRSLADALQGADLKLGPMNREELQQAIERPA